MIPTIVGEDDLRFRAKRELRKRMRAVRAALPASAITQRSNEITARIVAHPKWAEARTVALFMSLPDEVQLRDVMAHARAAGKRVTVPVVADDEELVFRAPHETETTWVTSAYGIDEPDASAPEVPVTEIDLVVVPALAIDPRGHRIGYGGGYYDRTLARAPQAFAMAVAFDFQLIAEVPLRAGDVACHWIVTDRRDFAAE